MKARQYLTDYVCLVGNQDLRLPVVVIRPQNQSNLLLGNSKLCKT